MNIINITDINGDSMMNLEEDDEGEEEEDHGGTRRRRDQVMVTAIVIWLLKSIISKLVHSYLIINKMIYF